MRVAALAGAILLIGAGAVGVRALPIGVPDETQEKERRTLFVRAAPVKRVGSYTVTRTFVGEVRPRRSTMLGFELGGMVDDLGADDGDVAERGRVIATLDTERLRARRGELESAREEALALLDLAEATERRTVESYEREAANEQELDEARFTRAARAAALRRIDDQIRTIDVDIEKSSLRSPFDAVVARRMVDEGSVVSAGEPVFELLEVDAPEARIGVAGESIDALSVGDARRVRIRGRTYDAEVLSLLPTRERRTRAIECVLRLDARLDGIRRGDLASLDIERTIEQEGFWLPMSAVTESSRGLWACFVAIPLETPDGEATHRVDRREVEVLHTEEDRVFAAGGVRDAERVIIEGPNRVVPGQRVAIREGGRP